MRTPISRLWLIGLLGAIAAGCGGSEGGSGGDSSSTTGTSSATSMTTAPTTSTTATTTASTTATTTASTETTETTDASTTTTSSGPDDSSSGTGTGTGTGESGTGSSGSDENGNGMCAQQQESCLQMQCCGNLDCCSGVPIPDGEAICYAQCPDSDRNIKRGFVAVDVDDVLTRVATLPITTWSYIEDPEVRHIGPMAQDFKATFEVGGSDKGIAKVDADGVALAAVQALRHHVVTLEAENEDLHAAVAALHERLEKLEHRGDCK